MGKDDRLESVNEFFDKDTYLKNSFNIRIRKAILNELIDNPLRDKTVLDIGCGDASLTKSLTENNYVTLVDSSTAMITAAQKNLDEIKNHYPYKLIKSDFLKLKLETKYDLIVCIGVVSHISSINELLSLISTSVNDQGQVILQFSDAHHFRYKNNKSSSSSYGYSLNKTSKKEFKRLLKLSGFRILRTKEYSWSFFPLDLFSQSIQFKFLNIMRKIKFMNFLSSEYLLLIKLTGKDTPSSSN